MSEEKLGEVRGEQEGKVRGSEVTGSMGKIQ